MRQYNAGAINNADIVITIGDSNRQGAAPINSAADVPADLLTLTSARIYYKPDYTSAANGSLELYDPNVGATNNRAPGFARNTTYPSLWGSDASFVHQYTTNSARQLVLFKLGVGGSTLISRTEPAREWQKSSNGLYSVFVNQYYFPALRAVYAAGYHNCRVKAIIINLGTNDCFFWNNANFVAGIPLFIANLRADLGLPNIPIYWVQVLSSLATRPSPPPSAAVTQCRTAIFNCGDNTNSAYIPGFHVIDDYESLPLQSDGTHFTEASYDTIGVNEANIMLGI